MKFIIRAKSAECAPVRIDGTWTVEAATRDEAISLMEQHIRLLPEGATWTIRPWMPDDSEASHNRSVSAVDQVHRPTAAA